MDTKAIEELIAIMDKAELTALRVDDGERKSNWSATTARSRLPRCRSWPIA